VPSARLLGFMHLKDKPGFEEGTKKTSAQRATKS